MFRSIRWRIAIPYVVLTLFTMLGLGIYLSSTTRQNYLSNLENQLTGQARLAADSLRANPAGWSDTGRLDNLARRWAEQLEARVTIIASDGTVVGESHEDRRSMDNHLNRPEIIQALRAGQGISTRYSETVGYQMMYAAAQVSANGETGFVRIALPLVEIQASITRLQRTLIGTTVLITVFTLFLATMIASRTTRPLRDLTEAAARLSSGDLSSRLIPTTPDEVGQLTQAFNQMAMQLQAQIEALETERSKIAAVLQEMTDGVLIADDQGRVRLINPAAEKIFSIGREKAIGRSLAESLRNHQLVELWAHCRETGEQQSAAFEIGSRHIYLQGVVTPLGEALPGHILFVFQNLTRIRHLETVRRDFVSNISHELRTPLASLKALTETLQEGALEDPPAARRFLQHMEAEVDALGQMVTELLELSRIESGRVPMKLVPTSPANILKPATERLQLQAERAGVSMTLECQEDLPMVLADKNRLEQVVVNLLHNAIKFTPPGGKVRLKAELQAESVLFSVHDTGSGISAADLPRIFERFYKADRARTSGGSGLGLAIARHTVEAHGGKIWATSQEGSGSNFYFSIPLAN